VINSSLMWLANHLWQSTLFALAVGCLTFSLHKNSARTRYTLWLAASCKFLVPFALLTAVGANVPWPRNQAYAPQIILTASQMAVPFTHFGAHSAPALVVHPQYDELIPLVLGAIWILGTLAVLARAFARWTLIHRALQNSRPTNHEFVIPVRYTTAKLEPAVVGILRPVLLIPKGLDQRLAPDEIRAVLAHEHCHVTWRDNLAAAIHMLIEAMFWFHPLVWWLGARLVEERERACDEQVLADGHSAQSYAEGILKVCEHYLESGLPCVAGIGGANLQRRIEAIMRNRLIENLSGVRKLLLTVAACATIVTPVVVGVLTPPRAHAQGGAPDTAEPRVSIRLWTKGDAMAPGPSLNPGRWYHLQWVLPLRALIANAYGVSESQVVGRDWSKEPIYQIEADASASSAPLITMKDILLKHFGLIIRTDKAQLQGYVLRVDNGGSKLMRHVAVTWPAGGRILPNGIDMTDEPLSTLVMHLERNLVLAAPVIDETRLEGNYAYKVTWVQPFSDTPADPAAVARALQEQLGLRLEAGSVNADVINVVSVKPPEEVVTPSITFNFRDASIEQVIAAVQLATHKTFVIDPRVHAKVTLYSPTPTSPEQFYRLFLNMLRENHLSAESKGDVIQIKPEPPPVARKENTNGRLEKISRIRD
jgi:bla regulator protein BlaR1